MVEMILLNSFAVALFFVLFSVTAYIYSKDKDNYPPLYLAIAFLFLTVREVTFLIVNVPGIDQNIIVIGYVLSYFAAILFLWTFLSEERVMKDLRRIRNAFH